MVKCGMAKLSEKEKRAAARREWPVAVYQLGEEPGDDLSASTTAEERLGMMWELAQRAWLFCGKPIPDYKIKDAPGRVIRPQV